MHISDDVKEPLDRITGTDVMAAIGTTSSRAVLVCQHFSVRPGSAKRMSNWRYRRWRDMRWRRLEERQEGRRM